MAKAIKLHGRSNYDNTIHNYKGRTYGFASRNFYASFIAARRTFQRMQRTRKIKPLGVVPKTETIVLPEPMSLAKILKRSAMDLVTFKSLNPSILSDTYGRNKHKPLPKYFELTVPRKDARKIKMALITPKRKRYARR